MSSYFYVGVGGSGAKLLQTLIHLSAAGMLPEPSRTLVSLLVDSDDANGNIDAAKEAFETYKAVQTICEGKMGSAESNKGEQPLLQTKVEIRGPWSPVTDTQVELGEFFGYTHKKQRGKTDPDSADALDADLMDALFEVEEINLEIKQGFRGRPAIGASILSATIDFETVGSEWQKLATSVRNNDALTTPILLAGSVFGGTGAAGVPTVLKKLKKKLQGETNPHEATVDGAPKEKNFLGLVLFLPYFTYDKVIKDGKEVPQADPSQFDAAAAEALKYYYDFKFLTDCQAIYTVGEQDKAKMPRPAVGAAEQRNPPHFLELVAGLGALDFFSQKPLPDADHRLMVAARARKQLLKWEDLPASKERLKSLKRMILFAVVFRHVFYRKILEESHLDGSGVPWIRDHLLEKGGNPNQVRSDLEKINNYIAQFLTWLLSVSAPQVSDFIFEVVDKSVFGTQGAAGWELKPVDTDISRPLKGLFPNSQVKPNKDDIWKWAGDRRSGQAEKGAAVLLRAIQDACNRYNF